MKQEYTDLEKTEMEIENKLAYVLAECYIRIPWNKIGVKSAHKFFIDRVRASSNTTNFREFIDVLLRKINVEFVQVETGIIDFLDEHRNITMMLIRKESTYLVNFALELVPELKAQRNLKKEGQKTLL